MRPSVVLAAGSLVYDGATAEMSFSGSAAPRVRVRAPGGDEEQLSALVAEAGGRIVRAAARPGRAMRWSSSRVRGRWPP